MTKRFAYCCLLVMGIAVQYSFAEGSGEGKKEDASRSLGLYVTLARMSQTTDAGLQAIPLGALVSVVENEAGQKFAIFRQMRIPINDLRLLTNDPSKIAASTTGVAAPGGKSGLLSPGAPVQDDGRNVAPRSTTQEQILLDDSGKVISSSKTTTIQDAAGNMTTIRQGNSSSLTPERAARLAAAQQKINQQRAAISELQARKSQKAIVSGYGTKLKEMNDLLARMEVEYARMRAEYNQ